MVMASGSGSGWWPEAIAGVLDKGGPQWDRARGAIPSGAVIIQSAMRRRKIPSGLYDAKLTGPA